ncbi:hypothetical protein ACLOJK_037385 [Asimina triloba]
MGKEFSSNDQAAARDVLHMGESSNRTDALKQIAAAIKGQQLWPIFINKNLNCRKPTASSNLATSSTHCPATVASTSNAFSTSSKFLSLQPFKATWGAADGPLAHIKQGLFNASIEQNFGQKNFNVQQNRELSSNSMASSIFNQRQSAAASCGNVQVQIAATSNKAIHVQGASTFSIFGQHHEQGTCIANGFNKASHGQQ